MGLMNGVLEDIPKKASSTIKNIVLLDFVCRRFLISLILSFLHFGFPRCWLPQISSFTDLGSPIFFPNVGISLNFEVTKNPCSSATDITGKKLPFKN